MSGCISQFTGEGRGREESRKEWWPWEERRYTLLGTRKDSEGRGSHGRRRVGWPLVGKLGCLQGCGLDHTVGDLARTWEGGEWGGWGDGGTGKLSGMLGVKEESLG